MKNHHKLLCTAAAVAITVALSGPIMAADAPVRKGPAPIAAPMFDWSGFYIGGHVGYGRTSFTGQDWLVSRHFRLSRRDFSSVSTLAKIFKLLPIGSGAGRLT